MEQTVTFPEGGFPTWEAVKDFLTGHGFPVQVRMIDGALAFPEETPPADWSELRVGTPQGMVTMRREPGRLVLVTWGNADLALREAWNALTWAWAEAGNGLVGSAQGTANAPAFRHTAELPAVLRAHADR
jgi:hypothetical protein